MSNKDLIKGPGIWVDSFLKLTANHSQDYWIYVNPINSKYSGTISKRGLVVFISEEVGRAAEKMSPWLRSMVGHYVNQNELWNILESIHFQDHLILIQAEDVKSPEAFQQKLSFL